MDDSSELYQRTKLLLRLKIASPAWNANSNMRDDRICILKRSKLHLKKLDANEMQAIIASSIATRCAIGRGCRAGNPRWNLLNRGCPTTSRICLFCHHSPSESRPWYFVERSLVRRSPPDSSVLQRVEIDCNITRRYCIDFANSSKSGNPKPQPADYRARARFSHLRLRAFNTLDFLYI